MSTNVEQLEVAFCLQFEESDTADWNYFTVPFQFISYADSQSAFVFSFNISAGFRYFVSFYICQH